MMNRQERRAALSESLSMVKEAYRDHPECAACANMQIAINSVLFDIDPDDDQAVAERLDDLKVAVESARNGQLLEQH